MGTSSASGVSRYVLTILVPDVLLWASGDTGQTWCANAGILKVDIHTYPNDHAIVLLLAGSVFARPVHSLMLLFEGWV